MCILSCKATNLIQIRIFTAILIAFGFSVVACESPEEDEVIPCQQHKDCAEDRICSTLGFCSDPWTKKYRLEVGPLQIPPTTPEGEPWEADGSDPDFYCHLFGASPAWDCFRSEFWTIECTDHLNILAEKIDKSEPFRYKCIEMDSDGPDVPDTSRVIGSFCFDADCGPVPVSALRTEEGVEAFDTQENATSLKLKMRFVMDEGDPS